MHQPIRPRICLYLLFFLLTLGSVKSQQRVMGKILEENTQQAVAFVNIQVDETRIGTLTDLHGLFLLDIPSSAGSITISGIGYETKTVPIAQLTPEILLAQKPVALSEIEVSPLNNPAYAILQKALRRIEASNPSLHNYKAILYHKMTFRFAQKQFAPPQFKENDFLLIESVSEKLHQAAPLRQTEKMLSGRVSGFKNPALAFISAQIQPFTFFEKEITLLGQTYLNPLSSTGLRQYYFTLEDTLITTSGDTLYYISFLPRKGSWSNPLKGSLHIQKASYSLQSISAQTATGKAPVSLFIRQQYEPLDSDSIWFPKQLESQLVLSNPPERGGTITASGKSYVATVELNPEFGRGTFSKPEFTDATINTNPHATEQYRYQPLTSNDSITLRLLDSLGQRAPLDRLIQVQRDLLKGEIPIGKLNLDYTRLVNYNAYEGVKTGLGLRSNSDLWPRFSVGSYATYGWRDQRWKYGSFVEWNTPYAGRFKITWRNDLTETGAYHFLDGFDPSSPELFRNLLSENMDKAQSLSTEWKTYWLRNLKGKLSYQYSQNVLSHAYPFEQIAAEGPSKFPLHEAIVSLKWTPGQKRVENAFGNFTTPGNAPQVWFNWEAGRSNSSNNYFFQRIFYRAEQRMRWTNWSYTTLRWEGGFINGRYPIHKLFSAMGTHKHIGIEIPYSMATMRPNEFAARHFETVTLRQSFLVRQNGVGSFKPEVHTLIQGAWSNLDPTYRTFHKGYYEAGIVADKLFSLLLIQYGLGIHYRIGSYRLYNEIDNWAFNLSIRFTL